MAPPCPFCGGRGEAAFETSDRNRRIGDRRFAYLACSACGTLYLGDRPEDIGAHYDEEYFVLPPLETLRAEAADESWRMDLVSPHADGGRLVEVGPGNGIFAVQAKDAGFETVTVERDPAACAYLRETVGVEAIESDAPEEVLPDLAPCRVIALWHVLEHLPRPAEFLEAAADALEPGGILLIAVPNPDAFGFRVLRGRWPHVDAPRHLALIPADALTARAEALGLERVALTTDDPGARHWNRFSWEFALRSTRSRHPRVVAARAAAGVLAALAAPFERREGRGAAYTVVLRRR